MKKNWYLIILTILILNLFTITAEELIADYPNQVNAEDDFEFTIILNDFINNNYDIKFEILDGSTNIAERFWEDEWKSTNFWLDNAINTSDNNQKLFKLKINKDITGEKEIIIKIRNNSEFIWEFPNNIINVILNEDNNNNEENNNDENNPTNSTTTENEIYVEFKWDNKKIINGKKFDIEIKIFNLKDENYDIKLWIKEDNNTISDRYDESIEKWKSGIYYLDNLFKGPGNNTKEIELRIREKYEKFEGNAKLIFKIRDGLIFSKKY